MWVLATFHWQAHVSIIIDDTQYTKGKEGLSMDIGATFNSIDKHISIIIIIIVMAHNKKGKGLSVGIDAQ